MTDLTTEGPPSRFGFLVLKQAERLKMRFAASGEAGMRSFISACIAFGITTDETIYDRVTDILGEHGVNLAKRVLNEGERVYWVRGDDDHYTLIEA